MPGMELSIRRVAPGDADRVAVLLGQLGYPTTAPPVGARIERWLADERSVLLAAEIGGSVVGVAALHVIPFLEYDESRGRLVALVVDDTVRGKGVGRELVAEVEREARRLGCRELELTSRRTRPEAHSFYRGLGYQDSSDRSALYRKPLTPEAAPQTPAS
jgi:GNAT superfamily N-acetyltransferase